MFEIVVTFGPDLGSTLLMKEGVHIFGRDNACDLVLRDPSLDRQQFQFEVSQGQVQITILGSNLLDCFLNGSISNEKTVYLSVGDRVRIGNSEFLLREPVAKRMHVEKSGLVAFHRSPYFSIAVEPYRCEAIGSPPRLVEPHRFAYLALAAPLCLGVFTAVLFSKPRYLLFALLSPLFAVANHIEQKRRKKNTYEVEKERFEEKFMLLKTEVDSALQREWQARQLAAPDIFSLAESAMNRTVALWVRGFESPDFLSFRLGLSSQSSKVDLLLNVSGDAALATEIENLLETSKSLGHVPLVLSFVEHTLVGLVGSQKETTSMAAALLLQLVCLHSPAEVVLCFARDSSNCSLLDDVLSVPHIGSSSSPLHVPHVAEDQASTKKLMKAIIALAEERVAHRVKTKRGSFPWIFFVVDATMVSDQALADRLVNSIESANISVLWLAEQQYLLPRQVQAMVRCQPLLEGETHTICFSEQEQAQRNFFSERVTGNIIKSVASALAPLFDASQVGDSASIPRLVSYIDIFETDRFTTAWIKKSWAANQFFSLRFPIGVGDEGVISFDLVDDGPHCLIGGTSGSGKSELLSALVMGLAVNHSPERVNFLFVDYKGGAESEQFLSLVHAVGHVTNLDGAQSVRALTSLRAELDSRMRLLKQEKAKSMADLFDRSPQSTPPALVIIVDEFATLIKEVPEFIDGVVDIAQRGRSLGIHLVLATQRPAGSVNENILANTNLRICLRMIDAKDSKSVLGTAEASNIPAPLKGRAFAKVGQDSLSVFQTAWGGESYRKLSDASSVTQLEELVRLIEQVSIKEHIFAGDPPWCEMLPEKIFLEELVVEKRVSSSQIPIGLIDTPALQNQLPCIVDFSQGALVVFGCGGSGRTTVLRTVLAATIQKSDAEDFNFCFFGIDFSAGNLNALTDTPFCGGIATGDDLESVTRVISLLHTIYEDRRSEVSKNGERFLEESGDKKIFLYIDGYDSLMEELERSRQQKRLYIWAEYLQRILLDGRRFGIFCVLTVSHRSSVRSSILSSTVNKLVLRQIEQDRYNDFGIGRAVVDSVELPPGRGFWGKLVLQVAVSQAGIEEYVGGSQVLPRLRSLPLPEQLPISSMENICLDPPLSGSLVLGQADVTGEVISCAEDTVVVVGEAGSGRSTALLLMYEQSKRQGFSVRVLCKQKSFLYAAVDNSDRICGPVEEVISAIESFGVEHSTGDNTHKMLFVDDVEHFSEREFTKCWSTFLSSGIRYIASISRFVGFSGSPLVQEMRQAKSFLYLCPSSNRELQELAGSSYGIRPGVSMVPGRGVFISKSDVTLLQMALPERYETA